MTYDPSLEILLLILMGIKLLHVLQFFSIAGLFNKEICPFCAFALGAFSALVAYGSWHITQIARDADQSYATSKTVSALVADNQLVRLSRRRYRPKLSIVVAGTPAVSHIFTCGDKHLPYYPIGGTIKLQLLDNGYFRLEDCQHSPALSHYDFDKSGYIWVGLVILAVVAFFF